MSGPLHRITLAPGRLVVWPFRAAIDLALGLFSTGVTPGPGQQRLRRETTFTVFRGVVISAVLIVVVGAALYISRITRAEVGSGAYITVVRHVESFNELVVGDEQRVHVRVEPGAPVQLTVFTDGNLAPLVRTRGLGGRLVIDTERLISQSVESVIRIVTGALSSVVVSGRAVVQVSGLQASSFTAEVSSGGRLVASGVVDRVDLRASASRVEFDALVAGEVTVEARDGAVINLDAREAVTGEASGGSEVRVTGSPATLAVEADGGSMVCEGSATVAFSCRD